LVKSAPLDQPGSIFIEPSVNTHPFASADCGPSAWFSSHYRLAQYGSQHSCAEARCFEPDSGNSYVVSPHLLFRLRDTGELTLCPRIVFRFERTFGKVAYAHLFVTEAMRHHLSEEWQLEYVSVSANSTIDADLMTSLLQGEKDRLARSATGQLQEVWSDDCARGEHFWADFQLKGSNVNMQYESILQALWPPHSEPRPTVSPIVPPEDWAQHPHPNLYRDV